MMGEGAYRRNDSASTQPFHVGMLSPKGLLYVIQKPFVLTPSFFLELEHASKLKRNSVIESATYNHSINKRNIKICRLFIFLKETKQHIDGYCLKSCYRGFIIVFVTLLAISTLSSKN